MSDRVARFFTAALAVFLCSGAVAGERPEPQVAGEPLDAERIEFRFPGC